MLDFMVCGSGFKAAYTALRLREMYNKAKISIKSNFFGGLYTSIEKWVLFRFRMSRSNIRYDGM